MHVACPLGILLLNVTNTKHGPVEPSQLFSAVSNTADWLSRMRTDYLDSALALHSDSVTDSKSVSVKRPLFNPNWLLVTLRDRDKREGPVAFNKWGV